MASLARPARGKIRAPKKGLTANAEFDFDTLWAVLEGAFFEIHTKNASILSFETLYRNAYKIVLRQRGEDLYRKVTQFEEQWLSTTVRKQITEHLTTSLLVGSLGGSRGSLVAELRVLKALKQAWEDHQVCMGMLTDVLMYMDRVYCTDHRQPSIYAKSMGIFRDQILRAPAHADQPTLLDILTQIILDLVAMDRAGERIDHSLVKSNIYMLEGLYESEQEMEEEKLYLTSFEQYFLETSAQFYREESERLLKDSDAGTYCKHAKARIQEENDRCRSTLSEVTAPKIQRVVEEELIRNHVKTLVEMETGVQYMVDIDQLQQLGDLYDLESSIDPKKSELTRAIQRIIAEMGKAVNTAATEAALAPAPEEPSKKDDKPAVKVNVQTVTALKWVEDILVLKDRFDKILAKSFKSDQTLQTAITRSMTEAINVFDRGSEYISLFIDENMKKGIRDKSEAEIDTTLEKAIILVRFLQDKDFFESYYKKHLAKRLLLNKSQSMDVEKQMISRMKIELGHSFTTKLEGMFKDMNMSDEYTSGYKSYVTKQGDADPSRPDLNIRMLTSMTWPTEAFRGNSSPEDANNRAKVIYPATIDRLRQSFERYYAEKHSGRKVTWLPNMSDVDMKATFPLGGKEGRSRTYDINCSTYSMMILLLFNDLASGTWLTAEEIQAQTNIPIAELNRNLQSLALSPKTKLLVKEPKSKEVAPTDRFAFNEEFTSKFVRFKVNVVAAGNKVESQRERKESEKKNNEHRGFLIEAAIVRIMKQRKETTHSTLLTETIHQLNTFSPDVTMIKKKIESLIEREYLERIEDAAMPSYRYLA